MSDFDNQRKTDQARSDPQWIGRARELLDESAAALDAPTLSRLNRARQAALAARHRHRLPGWLPALGLACSGALLLAVIVWTPKHAGTPNGHAPTAAADVDLGGADDSIEFYQNLDFYAWLDAQDVDIDG